MPSGKGIATITRANRLADSPVLYVRVLRGRRTGLGTTSLASVASFNGVDASPKHTRE